MQVEVIINIKVGFYLKMRGAYSMEKSRISQESRHGGATKQKTFILDASVLVSSPNSIESFGDNRIIIPDVVLENLQSWFRKDTEEAKNARIISEKIDFLREKGNLKQGVLLEKSGGVVRVEMNHREIMIEQFANIPKDEYRLLQVCKGIERAILVTKNPLLRIRADMIGVEAQDYLHEVMPEISKQYKGRCIVKITGVAFKQFKAQGKIPLKESVLGECPQLYVNQFVTLEDEYQQTARGRFNGTEIVKLNYSAAYGAYPRSDGQAFMLEAMMMSVSDAPLVIVKGPAGTGKTLFAIAAGLEQVTNRRLFTRVLIARAAISMDEEIGYLKGGEKDKLEPYMRSAFDNIEVLLNGNRLKQEKEDTTTVDTEKTMNGSEKPVQENGFIFMEQGLMDYQAVGFLRGRSLYRQYVIIDEAQNLTPAQAKAIVTRAGMGTKIILIGDPEQVDRRFLNERNNGLVYVAEKMKGESICWQITLEKSECERSTLAEVASMRL